MLCPAELWPRVASATNTVFAAVQASARTEWLGMIESLLNDRRAAWPAQSAAREVAIIVCGRCWRPRGPTKVHDGGDFERTILDRYRPQKSTSGPLCISAIGLKYPRRLEKLRRTFLHANGDDREIAFGVQRM